MNQKMFLQAGQSAFREEEDRALDSVVADGGPMQESKTNRGLQFKVTLILVVGIGMLMDVQAFSPMATIAVLHKGRDADYPTVCAIESSGDQTMSCWDSPDKPVFTPQAGGWIGLVAGGTFICGLQSPNRTAVCWTFRIDEHDQFSVPENFRDEQYMDIAAGEDHVCGIRSNHEFILDCWDRFGPMDVPSDLSNFKLVAAGLDWTCVVSSVGDDYENEKITCWTNRSRLPFTIPEMHNVTFYAITVGDDHLCALYDGNRLQFFNSVNSMNQKRRIFCWGLSYGGRFSSPPRNGPYSGLVSGSNFTCSLMYDSGYMHCWGGLPIEWDESKYMFEKEYSSPIQFSANGITAGATTVCGVGLSQGFELRSYCVGDGFYTPPQPFRFFLPELCSQSRTCSGPDLFRYDKVSPSDAFCTQKQSVALPLCSQSQSTLCLPCYSRSCTNPCDKTNPPQHCGRMDPSGERTRPETIAAAVCGLLVLFIFLMVFYITARSSTRKGRSSPGVDCRLPACKLSAPQGRSGRGLFTELTSVEHFCLHQAVFNLDLIEFSYKELEIATGGFKVANLLGQGSSGCVFKGTLPNKRQVAIKKLSNHGVGCPSDIYTHFDGELKLLARLRHENLVNLVGYCHQRTARKICCWRWALLKPSARIEYRLLVFEYMPNGTLYSHLHRRDYSGYQVLDWDMRLRIAIQAARGIEFLHFRTEPPIIHRDIKSSNILLDEHWNARLSDLGISRLGPLGNRTHISTLPAGTLGYLDPEYYRTQHLTLKSDVYSFGVVLLEILTGYKAIDGQFDPANIVERCVPVIRSGHAESILDPNIMPPSSVDTLLMVADIAEACVRMVQNERPSIAEVLFRLEAAAAADSITKPDDSPSA